MVISTDETPDYVEEVRKITGGEGAWGGIDPIAGESTGKMLSAVRDQGTVLVYGNFPNRLQTALFNLIPWPTLVGLSSASCAQDSLLCAAAQ